MTDLYFGIKLFGSIIVIGLLVLCLLMLFVRCSVSSIKERRIKKYLTSIGYERELINTASFGNNHTYGYKRYKDDGHFDIIRDYELKHMSLKQVKQKYN